MITVDKWVTILCWGSKGVLSIAVTSVMPSKTVVDQGYSVFIDITVENQGDFPETCHPEKKQQSTSYGRLRGFAKGNTITDPTTPVLGETDTTDNNLTDGWIIVAMKPDTAEKETHKT